MTRPGEAASSPETGDFGRGLKLSAIGHAALAFAILLKAFVFPSRTTMILPTLRVDLVGLPDQLKSELKKAPPIPTQDDQEEAESKPRPKAQPKPAPKEPPVEQAKPDELVLNPKAQAEKSEKLREKKLKGALDRIKALEQVSDDAAPEKTGGMLLKGNRISKGSSVSDDAVESDQASYYDSVRDALQSNWEIPIWLKNQQLSAKVRIFIDGNGRLSSYRFVSASGNPQFDQAVKRTIGASQPFPRPPGDIASTLLVNGILVGFPL